jgi:hypothetical protein
VLPQGARERMAGTEPFLSAPRKPAAHKWRYSRRHIICGAVQRRKVNVFRHSGRKEPHRMRNIRIFRPVRMSRGFLNPRFFPNNLNLTYTFSSPLNFSYYTLVFMIFMDKTEGDIILLEKYKRIVYHDSMQCD